MWLLGGRFGWLGGARRWFCGLGQYQAVEDGARVLVVGVPMFLLRVPYSNVPSCLLRAVDESCWARKGALKFLKGTLTYFWQFGVLFLG